MTSLILKIVAERIGVALPTDPWRLDQLERMLRIVTEANPSAVEFWLKEGARLVADRDRAPPPTGPRQVDRIKGGLRIVTQANPSEVELWLADARQAVAVVEHRAWKVADIAARLNKSVSWMRKNIPRLQKERRFPSPIPGLWNVYDPRAVEMWLARQRGEQLPPQWIAEPAGPETAIDDGIDWAAILDARADAMAGNAGKKRRRGTTANASGEPMKH